MLIVLKQNYPFLVPEDVVIPMGGEAKNKQRQNLLAFKTITERVAASETYSMAIFDEFAFTDASIQDAALSAVRPAALPLRVILSTPNHKGDVYNQLCDQAERDGRLFKRSIDDVKADWWGTVENADVWINTELFKNKSKYEINKQYRCSFEDIASDLVWDFDPATMTAKDQLGPTAVALDLRIQ